MAHLLEAGSGGIIGSLTFNVLKGFMPEIIPDAPKTTQSDRSQSVPGAVF
jgi:hypothetical protein